MGATARFSIKKTQFTPSFVVPKKHVARRAPHAAMQVKAFKENSQLQDWRVKDMVETCHKYFVDFLSKGAIDLAEDLFADDCEHVDNVWDPAHPTVGPAGMRHYLKDLRTAFPDFNIEIQEIATCDTNSVWVLYEGSATGLGEYHGHRASHHTSNFSGINIVKFNADRSKISQVQVYRSPFAEDREELKEKVPEGGFRELRLKRLV